MGLFPSNILVGMVCGIEILREGGREYRGSDWPPYLRLEIYFHRDLIGRIFVECGRLPVWLGVAWLSLPICRIKTVMDNVAEFL